MTTTNTEDELRARLRALAEPVAGPADDAERDVLGRVARRRRRRRAFQLGVAATAMVALIAVVPLVRDETAPDVQATDGSPSEPGESQPLDITEVRYRHIDGTEQLVVELSGNLPADQVTPVDDITDVDIDTIGLAIQREEPYWSCGYRHWGFGHAITQVTVLVPADWLNRDQDQAESDELLLEEERLVIEEETFPGNSSSKIFVCLHGDREAGEYGEYVEVTIASARSDDVEITVEEDPGRLILDVR